MVGYFRTSYGNFTVTDNLAVTPADFDAYCIAGPSDPRLPGGGGDRICGLADVRSNRFGIVNNLVRLAGDNDAGFGDITQVFNGFDIAVNARFGKGGVLTGGMSTGHTRFDACDALSDVNPGTALSPVGGGMPWLGNSRWCSQSLPWAAQNQVKFQGVYPLPVWGLQASATLQNLPGIAAPGNFVATNAVVNPGLGRNLSGGLPNVTISELYEPNSKLEDRLTQIDVRLMKMVRLGKTRIRPSFEVYNLFNAATINQVNAVYNLANTAAWLTPRGLLPGRLFKFSGQIDF